MKMQTGNYSLYSLNLNKKIWSLTINELGNIDFWSDKESINFSFLTERNGQFVYKPKSRKIFCIAINHPYTLVFWELEGGLYCIMSTAHHNIVYDVKKD